MEIKFVNLVIILGSFFIRFIIISLTCNGDEFNNCLSCDVNMNRTLNGQYECICDAGYYDINQNE